MRRRRSASSWSSRPRSRGGRSRRRRIGARDVVGRPGSGGVARGVDRSSSSRRPQISAADGRDVTRVEVELDDGAFFVVREGGAHDRRDHRPEADVRARRLRPPDVRAGDRQPARSEEARGDAKAEGGVGVRKLIRLAILVGLAVWAWRKFFGSVGPRGAGGRLVRRRVRRRPRARLSGLRAARRRSHAPRFAVTHDELGALLVERALLEGDFVLRSGRRSSWYLDKYRFETEPEILRALGDALAEAVRGVRAGRRAARRPGSRRGRVGSFGSNGVRTAVHHRAR